VKVIVMNRSTCNLGLESLEARDVMSASPLPVLMVLPNLDYYHLANQPSLSVMEKAAPAPKARANSDYSAIAFVGGWGSSSMSQQHYLQKTASTRPAPTQDDVIIDGGIITGAQVSGRITGVVVDPSDPDVIYIIAVGGGAWNTRSGQ
jgi:hypothetical protein